MNKSSRRSIWRGLLITLVIITAFVQPNPNTAVSSATSAEPSTQAANPQVIVEDPGLAPTFQSMCQSAWYQYDNDRGHKAYLTLNTKDPASSTNQAEWRPTLPQDGYYLVEAYIPAHDAIDWNCEGDPKHVGLDTTDAHYTVQSASGQVAISANQSSLKNQWLKLGEFIFRTGSNGSVTLTDLNGEENFTRTVSFSAMRFTWVRDVSSSTYLPVVTRNAGPTVTVSNTWIADTNGNATQAFLPGETIRLYASGLNSTATEAQPNMTWSQSGPCGASTIATGTANLPKGAWTQYQTLTAPNCLGVHTYTFLMVYQNQISTLTASFVVNGPSIVNVGSQQAFDKCGLPTPSQMQTWWNSSPYRTVNLYIGGRSLACVNKILDAVWVNTVSQQGWSYILTWVGQQPPCSKFYNKMSWDASRAYLEGRAEADAAVAAAFRLGFEGGRVIYYDVEGYYGASQACRDIAKTFLRGWTQRLHELGSRSGIYGSCNSYIQDWATINPAPDNIWSAHWYMKTYDPKASVWNVPCISNTLWANHQRLKQYAGDHTETWGGLAFTVDSNVVDGEINQLNPKAPTTAAAAPSMLVASGPQILDMQLLTPEQGWALVDQGLLWTENGGADWQDATPLAAGTNPLVDAFFLDASQGWLALRDPQSGGVRILRTTDGRHTWEAFSLDALSPEEALSAENVYLSFVDSQTGWAALKLASSNNFSLGLLFRTLDGGRTWERFSLPIGGPVRFVDANWGWVAGGVMGDELYKTEDGGRTWQPQVLASGGENEPGVRYAGLPVFENERAGLLPVTVADPRQPRVELFRSQDGGRSWSLASSVPLDPQAVPGASLPLGMGDLSHWVVASPSGGELYARAADGQMPTAVQPQNLPEGVTELQFTNPQVGWAQVQNGVCTGEKTAEESFQCETRSLLLKTTDGGKSWVEITP